MSTTAKNKRPIYRTSGDLAALDAGELREHAAEHVASIGCLDAYAGRLIAWIARNIDADAAEVEADILADASYLAGHEIGG